MSDPMTLEEIGAFFGISREAVRQQLDRTFMKVRKRLRAKGITQYSDLSIEDAIVHGLRSGKRPQE